jgi:diguanylate cyclase (GGDEF)-like protein
MVTACRTLIIALLLAFGAFGAAPVRAQAGIVGTPVATCVSRVQPGDTVRGVLARPGRFDCTTRQTALGRGDYWVLSDRLPPSADPAAPIRVRQVSLWQGSLAVYAVAANGRITAWIDDNVGIGRHIQLGAIVEHRFVPDGAPIERVLWRVGDSVNMRGIVLGVRIASDAESQRSNMLLAALYAGFIGLCAGLLFYNFVLWRVLHHDFQIAYCGLLACLVIYALSSSGILAWMLPELGNSRRILTSYVVLSWGMASALAFCACFFERRILDGWPLRLLYMVIAIFGTLGLLLMAVGPVAIPMLDRSFSVTMFCAPLAVGLVVWHAWQRRSDYLWLFALSWAAPMVMLVVRSLYNLNLLPWSFWIDNSTLVAMSIETLMASIAIAYRIRVLSRERDEAVRQEAISRELADTDPLTGLLNRRAFLARAIAADGSRTLMLFDIDHFKQVNDTIGHDGGDEVLRQFARTLRLHAPPGVLVARMGGEEFALLGREGAMPDPDVLLANVRAQRLPYDLRVTSSIGICHGPLADENDWKRLYRLADKALFEAKAAGRDRAGRAPPLSLVA